MEFCDEIFRQIKQIYKKQKKVLLYKPDLNHQDDTKVFIYPDMMTKDVDKGSFLFQKLFYQQWIVTGKEKRTKENNKSDCCCVGNSIILDALENFPFLGVYDIFDILSLLGLKEKTFLDEKKINFLTKSTKNTDLKNNLELNDYHK